MTKCCNQTTIISQDVNYIEVGGTQVGIIGLPEAFAALEQSFGESSEVELKTMLLKRLEVENQIPSQARQEYAEAFLREFRKYMEKKASREAGDKGFMGKLKSLFGRSDQSSCCNITIEENES